MHHSPSDWHDVQHRITSAGAMFGSLGGALCACQVKLTPKGKTYLALVVSTPAVRLRGIGPWRLKRAPVPAPFHGRRVGRMHRTTPKHTQKNLT